MSKKNNKKVIEAVSSKDKITSDKQSITDELNNQSDKAKSTDNNTKTTKNKSKKHTMSDETIEFLRNALAEQDDYNDITTIYSKNIKTQNDSDNESDAAFETCDNPEEDTIEPDDESVEENVPNKNEDKEEKRAMRAFLKFSYDELASRYIQNKLIINDKKKEIKEISDEISKLEKENERINIDKDKAYYHDIKEAEKKQKKKRTTVVSKGIQEPKPVPPLLIKFLGLPINAEKSRADINKLFHTKLNELGLKKGQEAVLDKKTAKIFNVSDGYTIKFSEFQTFLKRIYDDHNTNINNIKL